MPDLSIGIVYYVVFLFSTTIHEAAHALAAKLGGDLTAYHGGQVSLDPRPHIRREPVGMVVLPVISVLLSGWPFGFASAPYDPAWAMRHPRRAAGSHVGSGLQQLAGGLALLLIGTLAGEWRTFTFSWVGVGAIAYLIVFGSLIGYTAYVYVLRHLSATMTGTYAYANTVVAVFLGWLVLDEPVTPRTIVAMAIVLGAVAWVKAGARRARPVAGGAAPPGRQERRAA